MDGIVYWQVRFEIEVSDHSEESVAAMGVNAMMRYGVSSCQDSNDDPSETVCNSLKISG